MKFDVIIGNPPYQSGKKQIWKKFINTGLKLKPHYFSLIVPGGLMTAASNNDLRNSLLKANLKNIVFIENVTESHGVNLKNGKNHSISKNNRRTHSC